MDIVEKLNDLHKQATEERSHYYVGRVTKDAAAEIEWQRAYVTMLETALNHATECCSAFQSGGQFNHLMRPGEPVFNGVPRLVAQFSKR